MILLSSSFGAEVSDPIGIAFVLFATGLVVVLIIIELIVKRFKNLRF